MATDRLDTAAGGINEKCTPGRAVEHARCGLTRTGTCFASCDTHAHTKWKISGGIRSGTCF